MKEIYQQTAEEVLRLDGPDRSADGMSLQKERKKVFCRSSLNSIRIFWC